MIILTTILICITIAVGLVYLFTIVMFGFGWLSIPFLRYQKSESYIFASGIIPGRNEKNNIMRCLESVLAQHYQPDYFEIIIVDDHSTDNTSDIIKSKYSSCKNIILISNQGQGKKDAITSAIKIAKGEIIITLDADCVVEQHWLASFIEYYKATNAKMIVGSVKLLYSHSVFTRMQSLEFMALSLTTGGALAFNNAVLCNGANLAFTRDIKVVPNASISRAACFWTNRPYFHEYLKKLMKNEKTQRITNHFYKYCIVRYSLHCSLGCIGSSKHCTLDTLLQQCSPRSIYNNHHKGR